MGETVTLLLDQAIGRYNDLTRSLALKYAQQTYDELLTKSRIAIDAETLSMTAEDATVAIPDTVKKIWSATYVRSATAGDVRRLKVVSARWMDTYKKRWRDHASGEPSYLVIEPDEDGVRELVAYRKPDTTSSGSPAYPHIRLEVSRKQTLKESSPGAGEIDEMPDAIDDITVLLEGIWYRHARAYVPENKKEHQENFVIALNNLLASLKLFVVEDVPMLAPGWEQTMTPTA
jgi:hypothetical protein